MPALLRALSVAVMCALSAAESRTEETALPKSSPFTPVTTAPASAATPAENYELAAITTVGKKTTVNIYDKAAKKGRWIAIGETTDGIKVLNFDAARERVVIQIGGGPDKILSLRRTTAVPTSVPANAPWAAPVGVAPAPVPVISEPAIITPLPSHPNAPSAPPVPGTVAHQEQEARMLVSDLLEIGMAQRKAYEDAQRKAAEAAASATPSVPVAAPAAPTAPTNQPAKR